MVNWVVRECLPVVGTTSCCPALPLSCYLSNPITGNVTHYDIWYHYQIHSTYMSKVEEETLAIFPSPNYDIFLWKVNRKTMHFGGLLSGVSIIGQNSLLWLKTKRVIRKYAMVIKLQCSKIFLYLAILINFIIFQTYEKCYESMLI